MSLVSQPAGLVRLIRPLAVLLPWGAGKLLANQVEAKFVSVDKTGF